MSQPDQTPRDQRSRIRLTEKVKGGWVSGETRSGGPSSSTRYASA